MFRPGDPEIQYPYTKPRELVGKLNEVIVLTPRFIQILTKIKRP